MDRTEPTLSEPPRRNGPGGELRRIGIEIEFAALKPWAAADLIRSRFGGTVSQVDAHRFEIRDSDAGRFIVELDAQYAHPNESLQDTSRHESWIADIAELARNLDTEASRLIGEVGSDLIPCEVVCPPMPWTRLPELEALYRALSAAGAQGTDDGLFHAFGLHMNVEVPGESVGDILPQIQAYLLLGPWLRSAIQVDATRRIFPYIDPFPAGYVRLVCDRTYAPDLNRMIGDYLSFNDTRNRELDLLPLFSHLRPARVSAVIDDPRVKARPAYHWRLPNTLFGSSDAGPLAEWDRWLMVERLAADTTGLAEACDAFQAIRPLPLSGDVEYFSIALAERYRP